MNINICIVDDHQIFLEGLTRLLEEVPHFHVLAKVTNAIDLIEELSEDIDIILLDIEMPDINGIDIIKTLNKEYPSIQVLMVTMYNEPEIIKKAIKAGANGYVLKNADRGELIQAIEKMYKGENYYSPEVMQAVMNAFHPQPGSSSLSGREVEIIRLIADQFTTREIAEHLHLSPYTVETHRKNILLKLGLKNTAGLIRYSLQRGLID